MTAVRTPPHPSSTERTVDGEAYLIRPIGMADAAREREFIRGLSAATRYSRLMYSMREPSAAFIVQILPLPFPTHGSREASAPGLRFACSTTHEHRGCST